MAANEPADGATLENALSPRAPDRALGLSTFDGAAVPASAANPLWAVPLRVLTTTRERPLFSPSRRPAPPPAVAAAAVKPPSPAKPPAPDRPLLSLVGTIISDAVRIGVFADQTTKEVIRLRTGEGRAGWILLSVEPRKATFKRDALRATLTFPDSRSAQMAGGPSRPRTDAASSAAPSAAPLPTWLRSDTVRMAPPPTPTALQTGPSAAAPLPDWLR